jgi:hypothetical protein
MVWRLEVLRSLASNCCFRSSARFVRCRLGASPNRLRLITVVSDRLICGQSRASVFLPRHVHRVPTFAEQWRLRGRISLSPLLEFLLLRVASISGRAVRVQYQLTTPHMQRNSIWTRVRCHRLTCRLRVAKMQLLCTWSARRPPSAAGDLLVWHLWGLNPARPFFLIGYAHRVCTKSR